MNFYLHDRNNSALHREFNDQWCLHQETLRSWLAMPLSAPELEAWGSTVIRCLPVKNHGCEFKLILSAEIAQMSVSGKWGEAEGGISEKDSYRYCQFPPLNKSKEKYQSLLFGIFLVSVWSVNTEWHYSYYHRRGKELQKVVFYLN